MADEKESWNSENYSRQMSESKNELQDLQGQLENLMVKFGLRALKLYQTGTSVPLKPMELGYLVKYELENAIRDLSEPKTVDSIIEETKKEWIKQQGREKSCP